MRLIVWIVLVLTPIIWAMFSFRIGIDPIPILLVFFLNWGALFVGFKGYLIKSVTYLKAENSHYLAGILSVPSAYSWEPDINSKGNVLNLCQFNVGYADAESNIEQAVIG